MHTTPYRSDPDPITRRLVRIAGGMCMFLGVGHVVTVAIVTREAIGSWFTKGLWSAVPLGVTGAPAEALSGSSTVAFWAGPASFAVPLFMLGLLFWRLAGQEVRVPAVIGWVLTIWCLVCGVILSPSPIYLGIVAGVLVVVASRRRPVAVAADQPVEATGAR